MTVEITEEEKRVLPILLGDVLMQLYFRREEIKRHNFLNLAKEFECYEQITKGFLDKIQPT